MAKCSKTYSSTPATSSTRFRWPYVIDTRIPHCKLLTGKVYHGRCASKRSWFYGFKVQVIATTDGLPVLPVEFYIHASSEADSTGLRAMAADLPEGSLLYTDVDYTNCVGEDLFE